MQNWYKFVLFYFTFRGYTPRGVFTYYDKIYISYSNRKSTNLQFHKTYLIILGVEPWLTKDTVCDYIVGDGEYSADTSIYREEFSGELEKQTQKTQTKVLDKAFKKYLLTKKILKGNT